MKLIIISNKLYDFESGAFRIGGVETYMRDLAALAVKLGFETEIRQPDAADAETVICGFKIRSVNAPKSLFKSRLQHIHDSIGDDNAKVIIATTHLNIKSKRPDTIAIQHGIDFDCGFPDRTGPLKYANRMLGFAIKAARSLRNVMRHFYCRNMVCVDYNYFNWYRTLGALLPGHNMKIILNYAQNAYAKEEIVRKISQSGGPKKIVFARRLIDYRGCGIFMEAVKALKAEYGDLQVTFAGDGPMQKKVEAFVKSAGGAALTKYEPQNAVSFLHGFDISVVPTICSEGTSLSLLESMAAGCLPVATHVGGMTNIILDGYNGILAFPTKEGLVKALKRALDMGEEERKAMVLNAYESAASAFSKEKWERGWTEILTS